MEPTAKRKVQGRVSLHPRGFGFLSGALDGEEFSAFIAPPELNAFLADDLVEADVSFGADGRSSATALTLVSRTRDTLFGEVVFHRGTPHLRVDREVANTDWTLLAEGKTFAGGEWIAAKIDGKNAVFLRQVPMGEDPSLERVVARHGLRGEFSADVLEQARALARNPHTLGHRRDLRAMPTVTIDAPVTRDIDDAIAVLPAGDDGALRLFVTIADPAEHVVDGSPLDLEARARATSTYLPGKVLPMLPEELSAAALSLVPGEDRHGLTAEMRIDPEGNVTSVDLYESLMRSHARLDYDEVAAFLDRGELSPRMEPVRAMMPWLRTANARLSVYRARRGGVEVSREETRLTMDPATGAASGVVTIRPNSAHKLVERCMVAANEAVARWLYERGVPAAFRVHDEPDAERVRELAAFARNFGFDAGFGRRMTPLALAAFEAQINGTTDEPALRAVLLRALGPARYTVHPSGHFGLAAPLYLHFTSPLRRYADLQVHRTVKQYLRGRREWHTEDPTVEELARHINDRARAASRAETDRSRMLLAGLFAKRIGEVFNGHITRIRPFGLVVQLEGSVAEGVVLNELLGKGPWKMNARETVLQGAEKSYSIGEPLTVRVSAADVSLGRIEFAPSTAG